jgi:hypothetical protein
LPLIDTGNVTGVLTHKPASASEGAGNRARTDDLLITNQLLYQLSYAGADRRIVAHRTVHDKGSSRAIDSNQSGTSPVLRLAMGHRVDPQTEKKCRPRLVCRNSDRAGCSRSLNRCDSRD